MQGLTAKVLYGIAEFWAGATVNAEPSSIGFVAHDWKTNMCHMYPNLVGATRFPA
jgi:hypothetical protein